MIIYLTLANDRFDIKFCANYDDEKKQYYMPYLEFLDEQWDNPKYLYEEFLPFLQFYYFDIGEVDTDEFDDIIRNLDAGMAADIIELLERGKQLGWDRL